MGLKQRQAELEILEGITREIEAIRENSRKFSDYATPAALTSDEHFLSGIIAQLDRVVQMLAIVAVLGVEARRRDLDN